MKILKIISEWASLIGFGLCFALLGGVVGKEMTWHVIYTISILVVLASAHLLAFFTNSPDE